LRLPEPEEVIRLRLAQARDGHHEVGERKVCLHATAAATLAKNTRKFCRSTSVNTLYGGTRHAYCLNSDVYWDYSKRIMPPWPPLLASTQLIAWQIDNALAGTRRSFLLTEPGSTARG
jgi:hypothetical protein